MARPRFQANDTRRDVLNVVPRAVIIEDARGWATPRELDVEGFCLRRHRGAVGDLRDAGEVRRVYVAEIRQLLLTETGADHVYVTNEGVLRFGERSPESGAREVRSARRLRPSGLPGGDCRARQPRDARDCVLVRLSR